MGPSPPTRIFSGITADDIRIFWCYYIEIDRIFMIPLKFNHTLFNVILKNATYIVKAFICHINSRIAIF
ncbi:Uncharacterised protein [Serratia grimesii]|nr:Uncharacterised protein [Serratia grimesii]CAI0911765.1 Uncharacterised protein [Serratia grimesii]CAI2785233.1 Uncharacterised protein [Serratia grimesii]CUW12140.1 Uncharacterised protein [Serratia grimesii]SMZ56226.1 Uncharacterised protein [Serratia grimesii]